MVFSISPSVTVREVDATQTIPATANNPGALVGVFHWGPINERILITSENELVSRFGKPSNFNGETFFVAADFLSYANSLYVTRVISSANAESLTADSTNWVAKYPGALGNNIEVSHIADSDSFSETLVDGADILTVDNITFNSDTFEIVVDDSITLDIAVGDIIRVGNDDVGYQNLTVKTLSSLTANTPAPGDGSADAIFHTITFTSRYSLSELDYTQLTYQKLWGYANVIPNAPTAGSMHIVVIDKTGVITGTAGATLELYENLSKDPAGQLVDGGTNYFKTVLENRSSWIKSNPSSTLGNSSTGYTYERLSGGGDGLNESAISFGKIAQGYDLYKDANEIDISFVLQGKAVANANLANYIVSNITDARKDCMAFLSPRKEDVVDPINPQVKMDNAIAYRNLVQNSSYWFMDSGYKYRYDKYNDIYRWVPLNGDIAGLATRILPWESPAGYKRGIIKNVVKLAFNPNKAQRDILYGKDINPVISQTGQGTLLFGDKTGLGLGSAFSRINVRRLFITIEKAIATTSNTFLFDFNDEFTRTQFKNLVEPYLRDIQGRRGIIDFRVISDSSVNTPDIVDQNIFRANIFIKPARTINFIELTFVATRTGVSFDEIIGQAL